MPDNSRSIVLVANSLQSGGAEKQLLWIAETLVELGWRVTLFELTKAQDEARLTPLIQRAATKGVEFHRAQAGSGYCGAGMRLQRLIGRRRTVYVWTWGLRSDLALYVLAVMGVSPRRWISSLRNANREAIVSARWLYRLIRRHVFLFVGNTHANAEMLDEVCPGVLSDCRYLPNVLEELERVPVDLPPVLPSVLRVAMLGNIDISRKGYDTAILVAEEFKRLRLPVCLVIAGRPDEADWLLGEIRQRELGGQVEYVGEVTKPIDFLRSAQGYLLLSRYEGMPNALLEALALGLPAVATKVGDLGRLGGESPPFALIDINAPAQAVAEIQKWLLDWPSAVRLGRSGRSWCEDQFSRRQCQARLREIADEISEAS